MPSLTPPLQIVDDASSALDDPSVERKDVINANHMMMCRFTDKEDDGYVKSIGVIMKYMEEIREVKEQEERGEHVFVSPRSLILRLIVDRNRGTSRETTER